MDIEEVREAARVLIEEHNLGDFVYDVRSRIDLPADYEGSTWDHPKVTSFARAVETLRAFAAERPPAMSFDNAPGAPMTRERAERALELSRSAREFEDGGR